MKVIQINATYDNTSVGKIMHDIKHELDHDEIENYVIFGRGENKYPDETNVFKIGTDKEANLEHLKVLVSGLYYSCSKKNTKAIFKKVVEIKPDLVHIHCLNGFFIDIPYFISLLKQANIPLLLTLHAEFMFTGTCGYTNACTNFYEGCHDCPSLSKIDSNLLFDNTRKSSILFHDAFEGYQKLLIVGVSKWVAEQSQKSWILGKFKHDVVINGIDTSIFKYSSNNNVLDKLDGKRIVLNVTSNFSFPDKGGQAFLQVAKLHEKDDKLLFVVAGTANNIQNAPKNVIFLGRIEKQTELARLYSLSDITLFPNRNETFLMGVAESMCCGTPVVGYCAGGPESIAIKEYSTFVPYGDIKALSDAVDKMLERSKTISKEDLSKKAQSIYSKEIMAKNYIKLYKQLIK